MLMISCCVAAALVLPSCGGKGKEQALPSQQQPAQEITGAGEERKESAAEEVVVAEELKRLKELEAELVEDLELLKATLAARERELTAREVGLRSREVLLETREAELMREQEAIGRVKALSYVVLALGVILIVVALVMAAKERRRKADAPAVGDSEGGTL
jgi:hypothetical protein